LGVSLTAAVVVVSGCEQDDFTTATVGPEGGTVLLPAGPRIEIPPGALGERVEITIERRSGSIEAEGFEQVGDIFAFTPHGLEFRVPAEVAFNDGRYEVNAIVSRLDGKLELGLGEGSAYDLYAQTFRLGDVTRGSYAHAGPKLVAPELSQERNLGGPSYDDEVPFEIEMESSASVQLRVYLSAADADWDNAGWPVAEAVSNVTGGSVARGEVAGGMVVSTAADSQRVTFTMGVPAGLPSGNYMLSIVSEKSSSEPGRVPVFWGSADFRVAGGGGPGTDAGPTDAGPADAGPADAGPTTDAAPVAAGG
jgi:hypothetical protein